MSNDAVFVSSATGSWEPFEVGEVLWLRRPEEGVMASSGLSRVTPQQAPGTIELISEADESLVILEGHIRIQIVGGSTHELVAGSTAFIPKGTAAKWTILQPTVEFFTYA